MKLTIKKEREWNIDIETGMKRWNEKEKMNVERENFQNLNLKSIPRSCTQKLHLNGTRLIYFFSKKTINFLKLIKQLFVSGKTFVFQIE